MADDFSVIIRCRNEERWIGHTIQSVLDFLHNPEIIIINNNSSDSSLQIARMFVHDKDVAEDRNYTQMKFLSIQDYTPGKALNLGVSNATRSKVMVLSAHCVLRKFNHELVNQELFESVCLFGNQDPYYNGKRIHKRYIWSHFQNTQIRNMYSDSEGRYFLHNAFAIYRKSVLEEFPFPEQLQGKEDRYWAQSIVNRGMTIMYTPEISADHHYTLEGNTWKGVG